MEKGANFKWLKRIAKDERSKQWIQKIEEWHRLAFNESKFVKSRQLFSVNLGKYKIWFRKCSAYSSIDIYTEIFKENDHFLIPEFSGKDANLVIDLGANEGYYTLKLKQNNPKCKVIVVEPNPLAFEVLEKNIKSNKLSDIILVNKAVCSKNGKIIFKIVENVSAIGGKDLGIMNRPWLKEEMIKKVKVDCITLNKLLKNYKIDELDILKLDVEGMELEILKSSKNLLNKIHKIVVEWHSKEIRDGLKKYLKEHGFKLVFEEKRDYGDLYFINKNL
jgi:FkbM family methyltransferase